MGGRILKDFTASTLASVALCVACSTSSSTTTTNGGGQSSDDDKAGSTLTSIQQALTAADSLFAFDPDLAPADTAQKNADAISSRAKTNVASCPNAKVNITFTSVTVDFGPPPGCALGSGGTISGVIEAKVSGGGGVLGDGGGDVPKDAGDLADGGARSLSVSLILTKLVANGASLDGTLTFTTSSGNAFSIEITRLTTSLGTVDGHIDVVGSPGSATVDGNASLSVSGATAASLVLAGIVFRRNDCYPSAGTLTNTTLVKTVSTFDANTASSGKYTKKTGERTPESATFPPYGNCPPGPPGAGDGGR